MAAAVIGVEDKVKENTNDITILASEVANIKDAVAPVVLKNTMIQVLQRLTMARLDKCSGDRGVSRVGPGR